MYPLHGQLLDVGGADAEQDVLWLNVCVDDATLLVEVVHAQQHLPDDAVYSVDGEAPVVALDDGLEQVMAQHLKHHAHIWACAVKGSNLTLICGVSWSKSKLFQGVLIRRGWWFSI